MYIFAIFILSNILLQYNCKKDSIPEYLSITADTDISKPIVFDHIRNSLEKIIELNEDGNNMPIYKDYIDIFGKFGEIFKLPDSWHTTCLYIGNDHTKLDTEIYKNFHEGINIDILVSTFVYVPGKLILSPVFFDNFNLIENKYPHVTLMVGEYKAVESNYVLDALFSNYEELKTLYANGKIKDEKFKIYKKLKNVKISFEKNGTEKIAEEVYLLKYGESITLKGVTKKNYS